MERLLFFCCFVLLFWGICAVSLDKDTGFYVYKRKHKAQPVAKWKYGEICAGRGTRAENYACCANEGKSGCPIGQGHCRSADDCVGIAACVKNCPFDRDNLYNCCASPSMEPDIQVPICEGESVKLFSVIGGEAVMNGYTNKRSEASVRWLGQPLADGRTYAKTLNAWGQLTLEINIAPEGSDEPEFETVCVLAADPHPYCEQDNRVSNMDRNALREHRIPFIYGHEYLKEEAERMTKVDFPYFEQLKLAKQTKKVWNRAWSGLIDRCYQAAYIYLSLYEEKDCNKYNLVYMVQTLQLYHQHLHRLNREQDVHLSERVEALESSLKGAYFIRNVAEKVVIALDKSGTVGASLVTFNRLVEYSRGGFTPKEVGNALVAGGAVFLKKHANKIAIDKLDKDLQAAVLRGIIQMMADILIESSSGTELNPRKHSKNLAKNVAIEFCTLKFAGINETKLIAGRTFNAVIAESKKQFGVGPIDMVLTITKFLKKALQTIWSFIVKLKNLIVEKVGNIVETVDGWTGRGGYICPNPDQHVDQTIQQCQKYSEAIYEKKKDEDGNKIEDEDGNTVDQCIDDEEKWCSTTHKFSGVGILDRNHRIRAQVVDRPDLNQCYIVVRGTEMVVSQWLRDFTALRVNCTAHRGENLVCGKLHVGFSNAAEQLVKDSKISAGISHCVKNKRELVFTGHSLGGAIASIMAWRVNDNAAAQGDGIHSGIPTRLVTLGAPRPGDKLFANDLLSLNICTDRLEAIHPAKEADEHGLAEVVDPVTMVPPCPFMHPEDNRWAVPCPWINNNIERLFFIPTKLLGPICHMMSKSYNDYTKSACLVSKNTRSCATYKTDKRAPSQILQECKLPGDGQNNAGNMFETPAYWN